MFIVIFSFYCPLLIVLCVEVRGGIISRYTLPVLLHHWVAHIFGCQLDGIILKLCLVSFWLFQLSWTKLLIQKSFFHFWFPTLCRKFFQKDHPVQFHVFDIIEFVWQLFFPRSNRGHPLDVQVDVHTISAFKVALDIVWMSTGCRSLFQYFPCICVCVGLWVEVRGSGQKWDLTQVWF